MEAGEDNLARARVFENHLQNVVNVAVQLEWMVQLERSVLETEHMGETLCKKTSNAI